MRTSTVVGRLLQAAIACAAVGDAAAQVGMRSTSFGDLPVTLVYPSDAATRPTAIGPYTVDVAMDAAPRPGRHRLVVISHGTGGSAIADHALAQALVREGLVVAQPLHRGDNFRDASQAGPPAFERRPREVIEVIDALAADAQWAPRLQLDRVGVHGMSAGGVTALALAGAQWRLLDLVRHCGAHAEAGAGFCFNGAIRPEQRAARQARYDSARGVPELLLPADLKRVHGGRTPTRGAADSRPDARSAAVTLAVPV
jgi:predicted dienelactone hydrolase